jgi:hypothetical protein
MDGECAERQDRRQAYAEVGALLKQSHRACRRREDEVRALECAERQDRRLAFAEAGALLQQSHRACRRREDEVRALRGPVAAGTRQEARALGRTVAGAAGASLRGRTPTGGTSPCSPLKKQLKTPPKMVSSPSRTPRAKRSSRSKSAVGGSGGSGGSKAERRRNLYGSPGAYPHSPHHVPGGDADSDSTVLCVQGGVWSTAAQPRWAKHGPPAAAWTNDSVAANPGLYASSPARLLSRTHPQRQSGSGSGRGDGSGRGGRSGRGSGSG